VAAFLKFGSLLGPLQSTYKTREYNWVMTPQQDVYMFACMAVALIVGINDHRLPGLLLDDEPEPQPSKPSKPRLEALVQQLNGHTLPADWTDLICACLRRDPAERPTAVQLLSMPALQQPQGQAAAEAAAAPAAEAPGAAEQPPQISAAQLHVQSALAVIKQLQQLKAKVERKWGDENFELRCRRRSRIYPLTAPLTSALVLLEDAACGEEQALRGPLLSNQKVMEDRRCSAAGGDPGD